MAKGNVLVIGGTGLLGTEVCKYLSKEGYSVIAISRNIQNHDIAEISAHAKLLTGDICDFKLKNALQDVIGQADLKAIIVCSGNHENGREGYKEAKEVIHINLDGFNNLIHQIIPSCNKNNPIQLIICSSFMSILPDRSHPAYAAAKAALNQWVRSLNVRNEKQVNPVALILGPITSNSHSLITVSASRAAQKIGYLIKANHSGLIYFPSYLRILSALISISPYLWERFLHHFKRSKI